MDNKKVLKIISLILLVVMLVTVLTACGGLRLKYESLSKTMMKLGYKAVEEKPEYAVITEKLDQGIQEQIETVVRFFDSTIPEKKGNEAYVFYCRTSEAANAVETAIRQDNSFDKFVIHRKGRVVVYGNSGALKDIRGY